MGKYNWNICTDFGCNKSADDKDTLVKENYEDDENTVRGNWTNKTEYMLSMIGFAVGLGNLWRFPYLTYKNGGGAFLIPYFAMLVVLGVPLYFMESCLGQFCSQSPINVWKVVPLLQGTGMAMVSLTTIQSLSYGIIISYCVFYMFASFQYPLPWTDCTNWAGENCTNMSLESCTTNLTQENHTCPSTTEEISLTEQYWDQVVLQRSSSMAETGPIVWELALCLLFGIILLFVAMFKGIKTSGKVVYFTATLPYLLLTVLLIRGVTLEGAIDGIEYYIGSQSNLTKLTEIEVWRNAASQTFYSLSIAYGGVTTLSSFSKFHNNLVVDAFIVTSANALTSVYAGFAIFSILGHMAYISGKAVEDVFEEGFALVFIAYPDALSKLPGSTAWAIMFFFMLFILGLDSMFAIVEVITTTVIDAIPNFQKSKRPIISAMVCSTLYLLSLPCVTTAGIYWVTLIDEFTSSMVPIFIALIEVIGIMFIYGGNRFIEDIEMMIGTKSVWFWLYWKACWFFFTPLIIIIILVLSLLTFENPTYGTIEYPDWGLSLGWCMAIFCILWIPVIAVYQMISTKGNFQQRFRSLCFPSKDWHPYLEIHRGERYSEERLNHS